MVRRIMILMLALVVSACAADPNAPLPPLGDFRLGYNIVQARDVRRGPFSRQATGEDLSTALAGAIEKRLGPYDGDGLYHLGIAIGAYVLAAPGIPLVYTPKSTLMFEVTVYDNATQQKLNEKPYRIIAFEGLQNTIPVIGSGLARSKEEQLENLVGEGARLVQNWLRGNAELFDHPADQPRIAFDRTERRQIAADAIASQAVLSQAATN